MTIEDDIENISKAIKEETDIVVGIKELFKDSFNITEKQKLEQHDVDIRTRLIQKEISAMSVSNFLGNIKIKGLKPTAKLMDRDANEHFTMTECLSILMFQLKRHKISLEGKSRGEIIDVLKGGLERKQETGGFFRSMFQRGQTK